MARNKEFAAALTAAGLDLNKIIIHFAMMISEPLRKYAKCLIILGATI